MEDIDPLEPASERTTHDRRTVTSLDIQRLITTNQGIANTVQSLVATINNHETRITVLEVKHNLSTQETAEIKKNSEQTLAVLAEHTKNEDKDRQRLLLAVISTLISVLSAIAFFIGQRLFAQ